MKNNILAFLFALLSTFNLLGQGDNLVPNQDFDYVFNCGFIPGFIGVAAPWFSPNGFSTDIAHECGITEASIPSNQWGYQPAAKGGGYAGLRPVLKGDNLATKDYREYLAVPLNDSLEAGQWYELSFKVSPGERSKIITDAIGMYLTKDSIPDSRVLEFEYHLRNPKGEFLNQFETWKTIKGSYKATGGEKFLVIGNFQTDDKTETFISDHEGGIEESAYLFVDDVLVRKCARDLPDQLVSASDSIICTNENITLSTSLTSSWEYSWFNGSTAPTIDVNSAGSYKFEVKINGCNVQEIIDIKSVIPSNLSLTGDTAICSGESLVFNVLDTNLEWSWSDLYLSPQRTSDPSKSTYALTTVKQGCQVIDTLKISTINDLSNFKDSTIVSCFGESLVLSFDLDQTEVLWNQQFTSDRFEVEESGSISIQLSNRCNLVNLTYDVEEEVCNCEFNLPNMFSPNGDSKGDRFEFNTPLNTSNFHLTVFNRQGRIVYQGAPNWDGTNNNTDLPAGVYYTKITYKCGYQPLETKTINGTLTLLR